MDSLEEKIQLLIKVKITF